MNRAPTISRLFALCALVAWLVQPGMADISTNITTTGDVSVTVGSNQISAVTTNNTVLPVSVGVGFYPGQTESYGLVATNPFGLYAYTNGVPGSGFVLGYSNQSGTVTVVNEGNLIFRQAPGAQTGEVGNGAIVALGLPGGSSASSQTYRQGSEVVVLNLGSIVVEGDGNYLASTPLYPSAFRMAAMSGISAASFGFQGTNSSVTYAGGPVSVESANGPIIISNPNKEIVSAGISAATATGPGGTYGTNIAAPVGVLLDSGSISNSAVSGVGIMATATGAQFIDGGPTNTAFGNDVGVGLKSGTIIRATGDTGVGVFAASQVYVANDPKKDSTVQAGNVKVVSEGALIATGNSNSVFSAGILAVSAGTDLLLNPFSSQTVNGTGFGSASSVTVTNTANIATEGTLSVGLAGLSLGGAAVATSNNGDEESYLGNSGGETDGIGAAVTISNAGTITTVGASAYGIVALSSGGGGLINNILPAGGNTNSTNGLVVGNNSSSSGSSASPGATVSVIHVGSVTTGDGAGTGAASPAIIAQSIGGAGGNGGGKHPALFVGDKGGQGGAGGEVDVNTSTASQVTTKDTNSVGILAQSIGGGGGNGGNAVGLFVSVGGQGGSGGAGGVVSVAAGGSITTESDHSAGIIAQSIGGGGGHGGGSHAAGFLVDLGIGGKGATGGAGGSVFLDQDGAITTSGNNSAGVILQSLGGGGGTGGNALSYSASALIDINLALGGGGTGGGGGGQVNVTLDTGSIITTGVPGATNGFMNQNGADSHGLLAQSIGGGGGQAGSAVGKGVAVSGESEGVPFAGVANFVIGGSGGTASAGGAITAQNNGSIQTFSDGSHGALVQSIGGGGGHGGDSTAVNAIFAKDSTTGSLTLGLGGQGGGGGRGGEVSFVNATNSGVTSSITTHAQSSHGILAQSIGGGGGSGGIGNAKASASSGSDSGNTNIILTLAIGGQSGGGGNAGPTIVTNQGSISTAGSDSHGILAQAVGGGGGAAGGGSAAGGNNSYTANVTIGRTGGSGGSTTTNAAGYSVMVANAGSITTLGGDANGITAQSIGGGGGKGGTADADASLETGSIPSEIFSSRGYKSDVTVGGNGGSGGGGGPVMVQNTGSISTDGSRAHGVLAQAVSGGGGLGGSATSGANPGFFSLMDPTGFFSIDVAVGGRGGDSSSGGAVTVSNFSAVGTAGYGANGILAQSIAGGGGVGADGTADANTTLGLGIGVNRTASGTDAANGGAVTVLQGGQVTTADADAVGVLAQSVAGGGGVASAGGKPLLSPAISVGVLPLRADVSLGINLSGSDAMNGGAVTITQNVSSTTTTLGDWSHGLVGQSIGAGGGKASTIFGTSGPAIADLDFQLGATNGQGDGGLVNLQAQGSVSTGTNGGGFSAIGILGQSIGGGGGLATDASKAGTGTISLGSTPDAKGNGGDVNFSGAAGISTAGQAAHGIVLQSVGAGGGLAGSGSSQTMTGVTNPAPNIQLGGTSKGGGVGGTINVASTNTIQTAGANAFGVVLQSIGGGGGLVTTRQTSGAVTLGASGGDSKDTQYFAGGAINASFASNASIVTTGAGSHGLVAQSIGGGGGIANPSAAGGLITNAPALNPGASFGYGGNITITNAGDINVTGNGAVGILAQSIGGGGGLTGAFAGSTGGAGSSGTGSGGNNGDISINIEATSQITAEGTNAVGIFAQNVTAGPNGLGRVDLSVRGKVYGGSGAGGRAVWVDGGSGNSLLVTNGGTVVGTGTQQSAVYYSGAGNLNVTNAGGTVSGTLWLSGSTNSNQGTFTNDYNAGFLTQGTNNAIIQDGGTTTIGTDYRYAAGAIFLGAYHQSSGGGLYMDIFGVGDNDQILFQSVGHGSFAGSIFFSFTNYNANAGDVFTMIGPAAATFSNSFAFASISVTGLATGVSWTNRVENDSFQLVITGVPEPSTVALAALGLAAVLWSARRRF